MSHRNGSTLIEELFHGRRQKDLSVEERRAYQREWKRRHPEYRERKRRQQQERYATDETYRERTRRRSRAWHGAQEPLSARVKRLRHSAKHRKIAWDLTDEFVLKTLMLPCEYCGLLSDGGGTLDRIDSNGGYSVENVTPACLKCNVAKWTQTTDEFRSWVARVYERICL